MSLQQALYGIRVMHSSMSSVTMVVTPRCCLDGSCPGPRSRAENPPLGTTELVDGR